MPEVVQVPSDDTEALAVLMAEHGGEVAAVITEPVQGAGGVFPPADGYLAELRRLCDHHGAFLDLRRGDHRASAGSARGSPPTTTASCPT